MKFKLITALVALTVLAGCSSTPVQEPTPDVCVEVQSVVVQEQPSGKIEHAKPGREWKVVLNTSTGELYKGKRYTKESCTNPVAGYYVCNDGTATYIINITNETLEFTMNSDQSYGHKFLNPTFTQTACPRT